MAHSKNTLLKKYFEGVSKTLDSKIVKDKSNDFIVP
jgi:hypothetical protein